VICPAGGMAVPAGFVGRGAGALEEKKPSIIRGDQRMSQERTYNKRRALNLSVNRAMQLRMIGKISCILLVSLLISSGVYYYYANQEISASFRLFHVRARNFLDFLFPVVGISFAVSVLVGTIASLFFPKNVAGPLYRIEQDLRRMAEGDLSIRINLRNGDEGGSVAGHINQLVGLFRETIISVQDSLQSFREICGTGAEMSPEERLEELRVIHDRIDKKINKFKVAAEK
jgi:methyl-accepting chemotaxis protein